ncbi:hypothetical protein MKZ38_000825 [Zalerion maritima]|uniref:Uncharacterized protein n=1 Tax=Zalerion maritima TaxID=339359 RepID=A0AAD5RRN3_9PEZI|nr:hypothetical protein MKZ38_000825 [Zalerion maritima]
MLSTSSLATWATALLFLSTSSAQTPPKDIDTIGIKWRADRNLNKVLMQAWTLNETNLLGQSCADIVKEAYHSIPKQGSENVIQDGNFADNHLIVIGGKMPTGLDPSGHNVKLGEKPLVYALGPMKSEYGENHYQLKETKGSVWRLGANYSEVVFYLDFKKPHGGVEFMKPDTMECVEVPSTLSVEEPNGGHTTSSDQGNSLPQLPDKVQLMIVPIILGMITWLVKDGKIIKDRLAQLVKLIGRQKKGPDGKDQQDPNQNPKNQAGKKD